MMLEGDIHQIRVKIAHLVTQISLSRLIQYISVFLLEIACQNAGHHIVFFLRCRQSEFRVKICFCLFFTSFDRVLAADHEYLLFSLTKFFGSVEKYEKLDGCHFSRKPHLFQNVRNFLLCFFVSF